MHWSESLFCLQNVARYAGINHSSLHLWIDVHFCEFQFARGSNRVLFSKSFNLHDIQYSSKISSPNHIIFYQFKMITSENKHRIHENICADEWPYKCQVECRKLNVSLFLSRGGYLFAGSGKIRLVVAF